MKIRSVAGIGLIVALAACSEGGSSPGEQNTSGGTGGGTGGGLPAGGTGGSSSGAGGATGGLAPVTGGSAGLSSSGGTGGTLAGSAGSGTATGGSAGTGVGGVPPAGGAPGAGGADAAGGAPIGGMAGAATGGAGGDGGSTVMGLHVQLDKTFQTIQGFGLNTALMPSNYNIPISTVFSTNGPDGIGLSILRIGMNPDGSLTGKYVSDAKMAGAKIIGSCWSPPASCKSNNNTQQGGYLLEKCFDSWATTIANFAKDQKLYAMSVGNESDFASCKSKGPPCTSDYDTTTYTAKQMVAWVKVAGAKIRELAPDTLVIAPEASEWIHAWSNASATGSTVDGHPHSTDPLNCGCFSNTPTDEGCAQTCLDGNGYDYGHWLWKDQEAWKSFDIFGVHEYDAQKAYPWPADVNDGKRDKEVWQTEMSGVMYWPEHGPSTDIDNGVAVAGWIHSALTVGEASAWLYWWYQAYYDDDNEGLALTHNATDGSTPAKRYYTLGNYSKFVRPGYIAVEVAENDNPDVLLSAFKSPDGTTVVIVAVNKGGASASPEIAFAGGTAPSSCTPTVTSASENLKDGTPVTVTDGVLKTSLPSKTVTTYVCK